jgi:hypothetical protein
MAIILDGTNGISDVRSTTDGSAATPAIRGTDTNTGIFFPAADTIAFAEGGAEIARFDSSGNLGIGTATINNVVTTYRGAGVNNYIQFTNSTTGTASTDGCLIGVSADDTALRLRVLEAAPMIFTTSDTERMRIDSSGNVGIGITPAKKFHVKASDSMGSGTGLSEVALLTNSNLQASGVAGDRLGIVLSAQDDLTDRKCGMYVTAQNANCNNPDLAFWQTGQGIAYREVARFQASTGSLLMNSTTNVAGQIWIGVKAGVLNGIEMAPTTAASYGAMTFRKNDNSSIGSISCTTSATAFNTTSDYRLKENIAPMTGGLDKVALLKPVTYTWKDGGESAEGFIAHELAEVCPHAVTGEKDAVDEDGNPKYQGIDVSFLVATLTAAIQEQQVIINELKSRIETLESK